MKKLALLMGVIFGVASCVKEASGPSLEMGNSIKTVSFSFNVKPQADIETRSIDIGTYQDDEIERLDIYVYGEDKVLIEHVTLSGNAIDGEVYSESLVEKSRRTYLFVANLDAACAEYLAQNTSDHLENWYGYIPYSENYKPNKPVMGGTAYAYFDSDKEVVVDLYRYVYRIELGSITADFDDPELMNKDIFVKRVVLTNVYNIFPVENGSFPYSCGTAESLFGDIRTFDFELFGGGYEGYKPGYDAFALSGTYDLGASIVPDELSGKYPYVLNSNQSVKDKGVLTVDVTGDLFEATVHEFDNENGEGRICSSTDASLSNVVTVNKAFYGMCGSVYNTRSIIWGINNQDSTVKLVVEVSVDGQTYFYPIQVNYPQPNTIYQVQNITLKGWGSEYCNFYTPNNDVSLSTKVLEWSNNMIEDIPVGYKGDSFSEIY